jgi:hypothetical protein
MPTGKCFDRLKLLAFPPHYQPRLSVGRRSKSLYPFLIIRRRLETRHVFSGVRGLSTPTGIANDTPWYNGPNQPVPDHQGLLSTLFAGSQHCVVRQRTMFVQVAATHLRVAAAGTGGPPMPIARVRDTR